EYKGEFIDSIKLANTQYYYSAYLPVNHKLKKLPAFIFFDPHSHPEIALKKYQNIADSLGIILIGYYLSSNETPANFSLSYFKSFIRDIQQKLPIDTAKLFFFGFSGGSRIATMIQEQYHIAKGIILSGASSYNQNFFTNNLTPIIHIVGLYDFNFTEIFPIFTQNINSNNMGFIFFSGKHDWPPQNIANLSIMMLLNKNNKKNKNISIANSIDSIPQYFLYPTLNSLQNFNIAIPESMITQSKHIFANTTMPLLSDIIDLEWAKQQNIIKYFQNADDEALIKMIDSLRGIKLNANKINDEMNYALSQRLLAYIGIVSYSFTVNLYQQNSPLLPKILKIYEHVEPTNRDMLYFQVKWYQKKNDTNKVNYYINKGNSLYPNFEKLINFKK
ncbi:MAG: hypothetical protein QMD02_08270, partial [Bacteroidales bacterium]|nr:hypothetical protein [Bacteroidales bacterium]